MRARVAWPLAGAALLAFGCADLVGITDLPEAGPGDAAPPSEAAPPPGVCLGGTEVVVSSADLTTVGASGGDVFAMMPSQGVVGCSPTSRCSNPSSLVTFKASERFEAYTAGSRLEYALQGPVGQNAGSIHAAALDGTGDQVLLGNLAYPLWLVSSGSRTFWVDDPASSGAPQLTPSVLHCVACSGTGDAPWITGLATTYGVVADASDVYVLADDGTNNFTKGIYGCSVKTACGASPRAVAIGLDTSNGAFASDGTNVYVGRADVEDLVRIDPTGKATPVILGVDVAWMTTDPSTADLFVATSAGGIIRVKTDGSATPVLLTSCDASFGTVDSIAVDPANVYVLMQPFGGGGAVFAIPRN